MNRGDRKEEADGRSGGALATLSGHSLIYLAGRVLSGLSSILLLPLFTPLLSNEDYGLLELTDQTLILLSQIVGLQLGAAVARHYYESQEQESRRRVVSTAFVTLSLLSVLAGGLLYLGSDFLAGLPRGDGHEDLPDALRLVAFILVAMILGEFTMSVLVAQLRSVSTVSCQLLRLLMELTAKIVFVVALGMGVLGVFRGQALASALFLAGCLFWLVTRFGLTFDRRVLRSMVAYSGPMVLAGIPGFVLHSADRFMIPVFSTLGQLGLYGIAYKFSFATMLIVVDSFLKTWYPYIFSIEDSGARRRVVSKAAVHVTALLLAALLPVSLLSPELIRLLTDPEFHAAWVFIPVVSFGYLFWGLFQMVQTPFHTHKRTGHLPRLVGAAALVNLLLNLILLPLFDAMGAAVATVLSLAYLVFAGRRSAERIERIPIPWSRLLRLGAVCLVAGAALYAVPIDSPASLPVRLLVLVLAFAYLAGPFLTREERGQVVELLRSVMKKS